MYKNAMKMILCLYLLFLLKIIGAQKTIANGNRLSTIPYFNRNPGSGVGVLQDLSNARILSNEPFIISFEFPKLGNLADRKYRNGAKRSKSQRKKNRRLRQFRRTIIPEGQLLERRKRLQLLHIPEVLEDNRPSDLVVENNVRRQVLGELPNPLERSDIGRLVKYDSNEEAPMEKPEVIQEDTATNILEQITDPENESSDEKKLEVDHKKNWEDIKKRWIALFGKQKDVEDNEVEDDEDEERLKVKSRKMWANCQLLKLLKAPQRNPFFYKILPPNYPALIIDEEKQLQCNKVYDITDVARDKKLITEKIEQLEKILSSVNDSGMRKKREVNPQEKTEEENTLQDETLQGKLEGEGRSDRSKRTKERQHTRRQRSKEPKEKALRRTARQRKEIRNVKNEKPEQESLRRGRRKDTQNDFPSLKRLDESHPKPEDEETEKKEKHNTFQDVLTPTEVTKVIKQKEVEANIFDKVLRAMKKYEDNNPYDESFRPQKRESTNENTPKLVEKSDSSNEDWELEDTIRKLSKILKKLGMKAEANKKTCVNCEESGEDSSEELSEDEKKLKEISKVGKSPKCRCADCPFCQNCLQCFKECKKAALASKWKQTPVGSVPSGADKGMESEQNADGSFPPQKDTLTTTMPSTHEDNGNGDRTNNIKLERMYRSKLPPSRDQIRMYFDNPENKLLVWTKRGRRTMPWGPLTSDLQLYRDRARQILKSAEDILQRIKETEEKIHTGQYSGNEDLEDKEKKEKDMDDIIKKVVNEDATKNLLRTPWEQELQKSDFVEKIADLKQLLKDTTTNTLDNGFSENIKQQTSSALEETTSAPTEDAGSAANEEGRVEMAESQEARKEEAKSILKFLTLDDQNEDLESKSIEAAVEPIEFKPHEKSNNEEEKTDIWHNMEDNENIPAKVEAVNQIAEGEDFSVEGESESETGNGESWEASKNEVEKSAEESETVEKSAEDIIKELQKAVAEENETSENSLEVAREKSQSEEEASTDIERSEGDREETDEEVREMSSKDDATASYEDTEEMPTNRAASYEEDVRAKNSEEQEETEEKVQEVQEPEEHTPSSEVVELPHEGSVFEDQIKPIEENYVIKGVKQTQEEKEAILNALLNAKKGENGLREELLEDTEMTSSITTPSEMVERKDPLKTLVEDLKQGHIDQKGFEEVKKLTKEDLDLLVGEMQKNDDQGLPLTCETRMKLCQAACRCGTDTEMTKYDIIKGFLTWIKDLQENQMVPISVNEST